jgi:hypothetical protein
MSGLLLDQDVLGLVTAEGEVVAANAEFDGVAEGGSADALHGGPAAESHFEKSALELGLTFDGDDFTAAADTKSGKGAGAGEVFAAVLGEGRVGHGKVRWYGVGKTFQMARAV